MAPLRRIRRLTDETGANLVEAAVITPLLLLLTFSIVDFASFFYAYLSLENGVSQATRYGVTGQKMDDPDNPGNQLSRESSIKTAMRQATPTLTIADNAFGFKHMAPNGSSWIGGTGGPDDIEKVTVDYVWTFSTPLIRAFFTNGKVALKVESTMKNEGKFQ
jgi:TadE-like protein